jgi:hypothetical protein
VVVLALGILYLAREAAGLPLPVPQARRQVPDWWRTFFPRPVFALLYGAGLGVGFLTFLSAGTLVVVAAAALASGNAALGALLMAPFGLVRGASVVASAGVVSAPDGAALVERLAAFARGPALRVANSLALVGAVLAAGGSVGREVDLGALAGAVLALAFGWAAAAKAAAPSAWRSALEGYGLPLVVALAAAVLVPLAESAVVLLVVGGLIKVAGGVSLSLLAVFSLAILRGRAVSGDRLECGCFGRADTRDFRLLLVRNGMLAVVSVTAIASGVDRPGAALSWPSSVEVLPAILAILGAAVAAWALAASARAFGGPRR